MKRIPPIRALLPGLALAAAFLLPCGAAQAYVGPGLGAGAVAVVLGLLGSVLLAAFAIVWYPLKRILKKRRAAAAPEPAARGREA